MYNFKDKVFALEVISSDYRPFISIFLTINAKKH